MTDQATITVPLAGRDILFRAPIPGQLIILRRRLTRIQQEASATEDLDTQSKLAVQLIVDTLDVVESLIVNPEDQEFLEQAMMRGLVSHEQVIDVLNMKPGEPAKPGNARPAKKVANRVRTKR